MEEFKKYKFGDIVNILDSKRIPLSATQRENRKGIYPYYGAQGIIDYIDDYIFDGTYLLIAEDGENLKSQKNNIAQIAIGKYWVNNHAHIVESNGSCDIRYICYLLNKIDISGYITGSAQPKLNQANLQSIELSLPSLTVQKRIADYIDLFDSKISLNRRINDNLEQQAQLLFDNLIDASDWSMTQSLSELSEINPPRKLSKGENAPFIEMSNMPTSGSFPARIDFKEYNGGMKFRNGDTIMARITPCLENGKAAYVNFLQGNEIGFGSTEYIVLAPKKTISSSFLYFLVRNKEFVDYAVKHMNGSSGRQRVSGDTIGNYQLPILDRKKLSIFIAIADRTLTIIKQNSFEILNLVNQRDTLLPKLMSGELKINDLNC